MLDSSTRQILEEKSKQYGIPFEYVYAVVMSESGGNVANIGDNGHSFGLFQINKPAHPTFDTTRYKDVTYQADYWLPNLARTYNTGVSDGLSGVQLAEYIERYGERPVWTEAVKSNINKYYNEITGGNATYTETTTDSTGGGYDMGSLAKNIIYWVAIISLFILLALGFGFSTKELLA